MAESEGREIAVVGVGIVGLTTAIRLSEAGFRPVLYTRDEVEDTTSANAGAIWGPFLSRIDSRVQAWSYRTLRVLRLDACVSGSGVNLVDGLGAERSGELDTWWVASFQGSVPSPPASLPGAFHRRWSYSVPIIDMPIYLSFLASRLADNAVPILHSPVGDVRDLPHDRVVVAAGMGSRELADDPQLIASKGQLVVVANPGIERFFAERGDGPDLTYILPQGSQVVLGGTAEWDFEHPACVRSVSDAILARCVAIEPLLRGAPVLAHRVGLRACRSPVRLERSTNDAGQIIYFNYGHGGSGVSLSWGCAESVVGFAVADC